MPTQEEPRRENQDPTARTGERGRRTADRRGGSIRRAFKRAIAALRSALRKTENYVLGSTAAICTDAGLIVGLGSGHVDKGPIVGSLLTIALADNISDSLGIHLYREGEGVGARQSALATVLNFLSRLVISLTFIAIVLLLPTSRAIIVAVVWALVLLTVISYFITRVTHKNSVVEIAKHVSIAVVVIAVSRGVGLLIAHYFP